MDLRPFIFTIVVLLLADASLAETIDSNDVLNVTTVTVKANVSQNSTTGVTPKLPSLCEVCNCTDTFVNCTSRGLEDHLADSQWPKKYMPEVSFKGNLLVHVQPFPPVSIGKLILRQNHITKIDNCAFKEILNLTELDLSHNQLTSEILQPHIFEGQFSPESYEPLSKVTILNLESNALHTLNQDVFEHLENLRVLNLAGNPFSVVDDHTSIAISSLPYLEELDMSYCNIDNLPDHIFHSPRHLRRLILNGNRFTSVPNAVDDSKALEYLSLDSNPIKVLNRYNGFPILPLLKEVSLAALPQITEISAGTFSQLTALESLRVHNCPKLKKISEDALVKKTSEGPIWPPLKKLDLSDNAIQYLPALLVGRWDKLEELDLMNNEWSCDCDNQYLIGNLLPEHGKRLMGEEADELKCSAPPEHAGKNMTTLANWKLRCLDVYSAQPEKDAAVLVGILIGLLLAIPIGLALFTFWRRGFFFCGSQGPATFSRAFYIRTANDEDI